MKQKLIKGDEVDAICSRGDFNWKPGQLRKIKRGLNKRARKEVKDKLNESIVIHMVDPKMYGYEPMKPEWQTQEEFDRMQKLVDKHKQTLDLLERL